MRTLKYVLRLVYGLFFVAAGINHFLMTDFYLRIMPDYLPWHRELVYLSGIAEVVLGTALVIPRTSVIAAWGLIALLLAVFPANLHMALHPERYPSFSPSALWLRLPLQAVFIAWAWWYTRDGNRANNSAPAETAD